ncbi:hypothetical protein TanjilG_00046 [Lupinus angustifolius]|uniref:Uncharacterized protein n=1 Tax=Lupinus angustifolius TaxID=3871 RepID=A0A394CYK8_LUPAN|nr:hypothetical protein TanjilG_00046 [Lupinus angustifolius]
MHHVETILKYDGRATNTNLQSLYTTDEKTVPLKFPSNKYDMIMKKEANRTNNNVVAVLMATFSVYTHLNYPSKASFGC